ncbi:RDD family protein [Nocardioides solisilvae]|uniref:RDD family protein n=1 Tax=Nocardioides solisilvae TaxID=1542435 RepID=UPI0013A571AE|nr:RDD family protein [Nocardioides solisilvae]
MSSAQDGGDPMTPGETPEGWYADPKVAHPAAERWWNGAQWTAHTRLSMPDDVHDRLGVAVPEPGAPAQHSPLLPPVPQAPPPAPPVPPRERPEPVTPYGVALASYGPRIGAFFLDLLAVALISFPLSAVLGVGDGDLTDWVADLVPMVVFWAYHYGLLARSGATWGMKALGIGVRPWLEHARLTPSQLATRTLVVSIVHLSAVLPGTGTIAGFAWLFVAGSILVEGNQRRGLHETWSETCVVRTR